MSEIVDATADQQPPPAVRFGSMLKQAREAQGLSPEDVSNRLRLSLRQIHALETEDFAMLPEPVIARGFIRNYAKLLKLDAEPLLKLYQMHTPAEATHAISIHSANIPISGGNKQPRKRYLAASLIVLLALGGWIFYMDYLPQQPQIHAVAIPQPAAKAGSPVKDEAVAIPMPQPALPAAERQPEPAAAEPAPPPPVAALPAQSGRLKFACTASSWVQVTDRDGKEIFNKTKPADSEDMVEGLPPFNIVIGNAGACSLQYNDKAVDLAPYTRLNVARLKLE